jgi:GT2 family glycosyltransferase
MPADVTVVVITRDRAADLDVSLAHHRAADVIVVDNGSGDGSAEVARRHGAQVLELGYNAGAAARNVGARGARTSWIAFADDDSWWAPGALERAAAVLAAHPELALVAAKILVGPSGRVDPVCTEMALSPLPPTTAGPQVLGFVACGAVVRRSAFLDVGGFSDRYGVGGEEELLALDLVAAGWKLAYVEDVVAHHHPSPSRDPRRRQVWQARNRLLTAWLRRPLAQGAREAGHALGSSTGRAGLRSALREVPWVVRERRPVPAEVEDLLAVL